jgi:quinol monooxygenase YgiN
VHVTASRTKAEHRDEEQGSEAFFRTGEIQFEAQADCARVDLEVSGKGCLRLRGDVYGEPDPAKLIGGQGTSMRTHNLLLDRHHDFGGTALMSEIQGVARIRIHPGKLDEFKRLAAKCMESVRTKDTGMLHYEMYMNSDETECMVFERYRDSESLLEHIKNLGDTMAALMKMCSISGEVCGTPSPELRKSLDAAGVAIYAPYQAM